MPNFDNIPIFSGFTGFFSNIVGMIPQLLMFLVIIAAIGGGIYYLLYSKKFNIRCIIVSRRDQGNKVIMDIGGYFSKKDGTESFRLKKLKVNIKPPELDYLVPAARGNVLFLRQISNREFHPIKINLTDAGIEQRGIDSDVQLWAVTMMNRSRQLFQQQSFFEKYASQLIFLTVATLIVVLLISLFKRFDVLSSIAGELRIAAETLARKAIELPPANAPI